MPNYSYDESMFSPATAERGLKYFLSGAVSPAGLRGRRYYANVAGSYDYRVWLELDNAGHIVAGACDCPVDGACKHMAAFWFALQSGEAAVAEDKLEQLLSGKKAADLRALLLRLAENTENRERLLAWLSPEKSGEAYAAQIKKLFKSLRRGYDYRDAIDLGIAAQEWLQDVALDGDAALEQVLPLMIPKLMSALENSDDSDAAIADALDYAIYLLGQVLAQPPYPKKLVTFLDKCLKDEIYFDYGDFGWDLYAHRAQIWLTGGQFAEWAQWLDAKIKSSKNGWQKDGWLEHKLDMLQESGQTEAAQQFLADNLQLTAFREKALDAAQAAQDWPRMEKLLQEGIALAERQKHYGTAHNWKQSLLGVWQQMGKPIRALAKELAFDGNFHADYYHLWKQSVPPEEWPSEWENLLKSLPERHANVMRDLLLEEKQFDLLLNALRPMIWLSEIERYLPEFPAEYSDALLDIYLPLLEDIIHRGSSRKEHKENGKKIKKLHKLFPENKQRIQSFADHLKTRYSTKPRRPAMLEEWTSLGV